MEILKSIDIWLYLVINGLPHGNLPDLLALILSGVGSFGLIWLFIGSVLVAVEEEKDHWFFLPLGAGAFFSYLLTEIILKPLFARERPQFLPDNILVVPEPLLSHSFPSGHATVAFAMAVILSAKEPRLRVLLFLLAVLIAFSRIYLGVHYPSDVAAGALLGLGIGIMVNRANSLFSPKNRRVSQNKKKKRSA